MQFFLRRAVLGAALSAALITTGPLGAWPLEHDDDEPPQPLEGVEVWGEYYDGPIGGRFGPRHSAVPAYWYSDTGINQGDPEPGVAAFSNRLQDARCYGYAPMCTSSSTASFNERRAIAAIMLQNYTSGSFAVGTLPVGSRFPVVYADGGSEVWIVQSSATGLPSSVGTPHNLMGPGSWATPTSAQCNIG